jgi:hypothetical protein
MLAMIAFHVSAEHVKAQNRKLVFAMIFLAALLIGCIALLLNAKSIGDMIFPAIGVILFAPPIGKIYRTIKEGAASYPVVQINDSTGTLNVNHKDISVAVDVTRSANLRIQYKSGHLVSAIVKTSSGEVMRFEGYENMEALVSFLESLTPQEKITRASFYHH